MHADVHYNYLVTAVQNEITSMTVFGHIRMNEWMKYASTKRRHNY